jgi:hypothetical protein
MESHRLITITFLILFGTISKYIYKTSVTVVVGLLEAKANVWRHISDFF